MIKEREILSRFEELQIGTLHIWIERGWVTPHRDEGQNLYREIDVARVGLIFEFANELGLNEDAMDVVLPLLDQVHGLRYQLRRLAEAVQAQPDDIRRQISSAINEYPEE